MDVNDNLVFFSTIGRSDPIRGEYDGPFLHIIRNYKPKKAYIFLTKEMWEYDRLDNRYEKAAKGVSNETEIIKIDASDIEDAHNFLKFDRRFKEVLEKIHNENPSCEILINITSGTPQMQASLYVLSTVLKFNKIRLVQVSTPAKQSNDASPVKKEYNVDEEIRNNIDSDEELAKYAQNRCVEIKADNVIKTILSESIKGHITAYDYNAAYNTCLQARELFKDELLQILEAAKYRVALNMKETKKLANKINYKLIPVESGDIRPLYEYILYLDIKIKRNELAEFSRGLSPCLTHLFIGYLNNILNVDIKNKYCRKKDHDRYILEFNKIDAKYRTYYQTDFRDGYKDTDICACNLLPLIKACCEEKNKEKDAKIAVKLREAEEKIRNNVAHNIVSVDEKTFIDKICIKPTGLMDMIKELFEKSNTNHKKSIQWDSYDRMNEYIISLME